MDGHYDAGALITALRAVRREMTSARPDAPVVPHSKRTHRPVRATQLRSALARVLDHAARVVEPPADRAAHQPSTLR